jgi:hypothetical protein
MIGEPVPYALFEVLAAELHRVIGIERGFAGCGGLGIKVRGREEFSSRLLAEKSGSIKTNWISDLEMRRKATSLLVVEKTLQSGGSHGD